MEEIWKDIENYEGLYQVSNRGRVRSIKTGKVLKPADNNGKYQTVSLFKQNIKLSKNVHKLVANAFIPNPNSLPCVNHKDENKKNNFVWVNDDGTVDLEKSNLEWCDKKYNCNYGTRNKRVSQKVKKRIIQSTMDGEEIMCWFSLTDAHISTNISISKISQCLKGKRNMAGGYKWGYA